MSSIADKIFNEHELNALVGKYKALAAYCYGRNKQDHGENYDCAWVAIEQLRREVNMLMEQRDELKNHLLTITSSDYCPYHGADKCQEPVEPSVVTSPSSDPAPKSKETEPVSLEVDPIIMMDVSESTPVNQKKSLSSSKGRRKPLKRSNS